MDEIRDYFARMAPAFDDYYREPSHGLIAAAAHQVFRKPGLVRRFEATLELLGNVQGRRILDAGCGPGAYSVYLAGQGANVVGVDLAEPMIQAARRNAEEAGWQDPDFRVADVGELDGERFDAAIAIGVFDYLSRAIRQDFLAHLCALTDGPVIATFPKLLTPQMPIRRLWFVGKECPVYFYVGRELNELASGIGRIAQKVDCGPIWTVAFASASADQSG